MANNETNHVNWWPYSPGQVKKFVLVLFTTCAAIGGTVWGMLEWMVEPMVDARVEIRLEEERSKQSRWDTTGDLIGVKGDLVPYEIKKLFDLVDTLIVEVHKYEREYKPYIDKWKNRTLLVRFMDENGQDWWNWRDNRPHPVVEYDHGYSWIVYGGRKTYPIALPEKN